MLEVSLEVSHIKWLGVCMELAFQWSMLFQNICKQRFVVKELCINKNTVEGKQ